MPKRISISVTPSFASKWLVKRIGSLTSAHPQIDLQIEASDRLSDLNQDGVDIAIRLSEPIKLYGTSSELLAKLDLCAVCSPSFSATLGRVSTAEDLLGQTLIQDSHFRWDKLARKIGWSQGLRTTQFNQTSLGIDAACNGQGLALVPRILVSDEIGHNVLEEVWADDDTEKQAYHLLYGSEHNPERDIVIEWLKAAI